MGKWAEVQCRCPNRRPLPEGDFMFGRPHRRKSRLNQRELEEVKEWERTTQYMYECGHRSGVVIEFGTGEIISLGDLIGSIFQDETFEIFTRIGDWRNYDDELLLIQPDDAQMWLLEIDEIKQSMSGAGSIPREKIERLILETYPQEIGTYRDLRARLDDAAAKFPFAPIAALKRNVEQYPHPDLELSVDKINTALADATRLCHASIEIGNPIRMLW
ncbi:MAG TPA: hypothetical protein VFS77_18305 [Pyrinomonadaceae bacterium]|nr:hypothetical protein [Pyrinomonadaceae bacterium]